MRKRTRFVVGSVVVVGIALALASAARFERWRQSMNGTSAPTIDDLRQVYGTNRPELAGHQGAKAVVVGADGITVLCSENPKGDGDRTWLIQLSDDGSVRWQRHYPAAQGFGRAIVELPSGGFLIAGEEMLNPMAYRGHLLRVDASGGVVAEASLGEAGITGFNAVAVLGDGSTLVGGAGERKGWLAIADTALRATWQLPIGDTDEVHGVAARADGSFAMVATQEWSTLGFGLTSVAVFARDGSVRWRKRLPTSGRGEPGAVAALPDGALIVAGHRAASEGGTTRLWIVRMDAAGAVVWERLLGTDDEERRGRAVVTFADGGVAVAGSALVNFRDRGLRLARLAPDGNVTWERSFGGSARATDVAQGLARTPDGGLVLVGFTTAKGPGKTNVWILRLDGDGKLLWERVFGAPPPPPPDQATPP